jgi:hypothetical protein
MDRINIGVRIHLHAGQIKKMFFGVNFGNGFMGHGRRGKSDFIIYPKHSFILCPINTRMMTTLVHASEEEEVFSIQPKH